MAVATLPRIITGGQPPAGITIPTIATVADLARRIARVERRVARLPDDRLDAEQVPLVAERCRLMDSLAGTRARTLAELRTKLQFVGGALQDGDHDKAGDLLDAALRDLDRLEGS